MCRCQQNHQSSEPSIGSSAGGASTAGGDAVSLGTVSLITVVVLASALAPSSVTFTAGVSLLAFPVRGSSTMGVGASAPVCSLTLLVSSFPSAGGPSTSVQDCVATSQDKPSTQQHLLSHVRIPSCRQVHQASEPSIGVAGSAAGTSRDLGELVGLAASIFVDSVTRVAVMALGSGAGSATVAIESSAADSAVLTFSFSACVVSFCSSTGLVLSPWYSPLASSLWGSSALDVLAWDSLVCSSVADSLVVSSSALDSSVLELLPTAASLPKVLALGSSASDSLATTSSLPEALACGSSIDALEVFLPGSFIPGASA
mmetsp:Transcript_22961/g.64202  ORF Transcript_22961/g.64202 Transcript_22961/m.64202 type:complete len:315 (+) Transcript_22961:540-1484(+)